MRRGHGRAALCGVAAALAPFVVMAAPSLTITPGAVDFGAVAVGALAESTVTFHNPGNADLLLGAVSLDHPAFAVGGPSGGVPPGTVVAAGDSLVVPLAFRPTTLGPASAVLLVSSNDPAAPEQSLPLAGSGASGAVIDVSPTSFLETLDLGQTVTRDLLIRNTGDLDLEWTLSARPAVLPLRASLQGVRVLWDRSKGQVGMLPWSTLVGELEGRGAVVVEVLPGPGDDITTALLASARVYISVDVTSGWSAAEASALSAWVQAGGGVMLIGDNSQSQLHYNVLLTALGAGITVSIPWSGDTVLTGAAIRSHESTAGVTRLRVGLGPRRLSPVVAPAQVIVQANVNDALVAVATRGVGRVAMVGDELFDNVTIAEADGAFTAHNRRFANQLVDWVAGGLWLRSDLFAGTVAAADSAVAHLLFDATDLPGGTFDVNVRVSSNDATTPDIDVSAQLTVIGVPEIGTSPAALAFADTPVGGVASDMLQVKNTGTEILHVSGAVSSATAFAVVASAFEIAPGDSAPLAVSFLPDSIGTFQGTITITSDAGSGPSFGVGVSGQGVVNCDSPCAAPSLRPVDALGSHGYEFWLDLELDGNPQTVSGLGFDLHFDPDHLVFLDDWRSGAQITQAAVNEISPGVVRVGAFASPPVPSGFQGSLLQLLFRVDCPTCTAGDQSDLLVSDLVDDLVGVVPCCGRLTLADCPTGHGDVNADSTLSATDALCALKIFVNGGEFPPAGSCDVNGDCEAAAADVNCNGTVSPADAVAIYERVLCVADPVPLSCFAATDPDPCNNGKTRAVPTIAFGATDVIDDGWSIAIESESCPPAFGLEVELPSGAEFVRLEAGDAAAWIALESGVAADGRLRIGGVAGTARSGGAGTVARLVVRGGSGGVVRVADAVDVAFSGPREQKLPDAPLPGEGLRAIRPNPSSGAVTIEYSAAGIHARHEVRVHDVTGRRVRDLTPPGARPAAGEVRLPWDGRDDRGHPVAAGIYFVVLRLDESTWTRKVLLVR